jgi:RecG-like helicase
MSEIKVYSYEEKILLSEKVKKIDNKQKLINIIKIIHDDGKEIYENKNGIYMFFHNLSNTTYTKIENILPKNVNKNNTIEKKEYIPYAKDDFPSQNKLCPKLKFSNREKNLIKRCRYDESINLDNDSVIYQDFDVTSDSDTLHKNT